MNKQVWTYDIETLLSCFTYSAYNIDTKEVVQYVIHKERNDLKPLLEHLQKCNGQVGFNNVNFDYPIIHMIIKNYYKWINNNTIPEQIVLDIYNKAQKIINTQDKFNFDNYIPEKDYYIPQLDLFRVWHYDNRAKSTSLKSLEISMNYPNVMDMPISHDNSNITLNQIDEILEYNLNDVMATFNFYEITVKLGKIELRKIIQRKYGLKCINWNNGKIGENLILKLFCDKTGKNPWEVKKLRTERLKIALKDCIPNNISFESEEFNNLLKFYKNKEITQTKGSVDYSVIYKGLIYYYGTGGIHAAIKSGLYESDEHFIIKSCDVSSLYPNLPIVYNFYIEHLGPEFLEVYKNDIVEVRLAEKAKPKDQQDKAIIDGYKESSNIPYGKSNDKNSFLYDPLYSMKTTLGGQLVLTMLAERLSEIPNSQILMINTDGLEIKIPRHHEKTYEFICKEWEKDTKLILEYEDYSKMWIQDINTYGCFSVKSKIKNKGRFEVEKVVGGEPAFHKDNSFKVIPLGIQEFFTKGILPEETVRNHKNIYDFCGRQKFKGKDYGEIHYIDHNTLVRDRQQKNVRYFISNKGALFMKQYAKGSCEVINKGYLVTIFNKYVEKNIKDYDINYSFYIKECYKEINTIIDKQMKLL